MVSSTVLKFLPLGAPLFLRNMQKFGSFSPTLIYDGFMGADVHRVTCDQWKQKVTVTSSIAPERLLKRLQKIKKRTTFWPHHKSGVVKVFDGNRVNNIDAQQQQNVQKGNDHENPVGSNDEQR